jgi:rhodanese-related sulfurtransferase
VNINDELELARETDGAVIIDVRDAGEYAQGHIPGAINVSADNIEAILEAVPDKDTPLFTYCLRGSRSRGAVKALKAMGYKQVINMGGINKYKGEMEKLL